MRPKTKKMRVRDSKPTGMCPNMTAPPKSKPRKKPNPYRAPNTVKRYYAGIAYGVDLLRDDLIERCDNPVIQEWVKDRARHLKAASNKKLTELEKKKTKEKLKEWEEKEWERL